MTVRNWLAGRAVRRRSGFTRNGGAFTLVELLVVIGIITLMISLLLPAVLRARKSAQTTKCLGQIREIGLALQQYLNDNENILPDATASDSPDEFDRSLKSIDRYLGRYLGNDSRVWKCPSQGEAQGDYDFRDGDFRWADDGGSDGTFTPGYMYLGTRGYHLFIQGPQPRRIGHTDVTDAKFFMRDWVIRNIGGLKLSAARSIAGTTSSEICLVMDYSSLNHSRSDQDVYRAWADGKQRGSYQSNFLYLDGHAETRPYNSPQTLLEQVHKGIRQRAYGVDFYSVYRAEYDKQR